MFVQSKTILHKTYIKARPRAYSVSGRQLAVQHPVVS